MSQIAISAGLIGVDSKYIFKPLPVAEAQASSDAFVCEFTGGAAANETGVGGGLTGSDLVLTQNNSVPAASGGYRQISKDTSQAFSVTTGFVNAFAENPDGFSALWQFKDLDPSLTSQNVLFMLQTNNFLTAGGLSLYALGLASANRRSLSLFNQAFTDSDSIGCQLGNVDKLSSAPSSAEFMIMASLDYATKTAFAGLLIGTKQPVKLADFLYFSLNRGDSTFPGASETTAFYSNRKTVVGNQDTTNYSNGSTGVKVKSVTFAKYPCLVPA